MSDFKIKEQYSFNKNARVGDVIICPSCETEFIKGNYQQAFCKSKDKTKCKDKYWNIVIPEKRNSKLRKSEWQRIKEKLNIIM